MRTHGATRLLGLILSLRYLTRIQTSATDRSNKILSQRQWFSHVTRSDLLQQPVAVMCRSDLSHRVSAFREPVNFVSLIPQCFPQLRLGKHWDSRETKFTVSLVFTVVRETYTTCKRHVPSNWFRSVCDSVLSQRCHMWHSISICTKIKHLKRINSEQFCSCLLYIAWFSLATQA